MEIVPRQVFRDARDAPGRFSKYDPRSDKFPESQVIVDLRVCTLVQPPAILWCAIYLLLAKRHGSDCLLLLPVEQLAARSLVDAGLIRVLREAEVTVEPDRIKMDILPELTLPLTRFEPSTAEELADRLHLSLSSHRQGSATLHTEIAETFSELVNNAAEHSQSSIGSLAFVQFQSLDKQRRFVIGVADGGIGIRQSLERNPNHQDNHWYDWVAIRRATGELVSGMPNSSRGIGLFSIFDESHRPGRELTIHSGRGIVTLSRDSQARMIRANLFPGALAFVSIPS